MSYTSEVKKEMMEEWFESDCCKMASLCATINTLGSLIINREGFTFSIRTDNQMVLDNVCDIIKSLYSETISNLKVDEEVVGKCTIQEMVIPREIGNRILKDCGIVRLDESNNWVLNKSIDHHLIIEDCCKKAYIKTAFLCVGSISVPIQEEQILDKNNKSGYHFELEFTNTEQAKAVANLLGEFGFITRRVERNGKSVVYMKESEAIADFVGFVGATKSYLRLQDEIIKREMRNSVNRQSNCISANIDKTVNASLSQLKAIGIIEDTIGIESLPESLQRVARLRKEHTDASLSELVQLLGDGATKSGVNYKLKRLEEIANKL